MVAAQESLDFTRAYARAEDPQESWDAARSISAECISDTQQKVLEVLRLQQPATAELLVALFRISFPASTVSDQRIRTALADTEKLGLTYRSPGGVSSRGRAAALWSLLGGDASTETP